MARKSTSRPARWADACSNARADLERLQAHFEMTAANEAEPDVEKHDLGPIMTAADITAAVGCIESNLEELESLQGEYQDWLDGMPESLQSSPTADKLNEVTSLTINTSVEEDGSDVEERLSDLDEYDGVDLPRGFGKD